MGIPRGDSTSDLITSEKPATEDSRKPHCAGHQHFLASCPVCKKAWANMQPYPVKKSDSPARSFGVTGDITSATFADPTYSRYGSKSINLNDPNMEPEASLSLTAIRFILRLIWPFSRII